MRGIIKCDRCGKIEQNEHNLFLNWHKVDEIHDLCSSCYNEYAHIIDSFIKERKGIMAPSGNSLFEEFKGVENIVKKVAREVAKPIDNINQQLNKIKNGVKK